jgi:hypothetical protein
MRVTRAWIRLIARPILVWRQLFTDVAPAGGRDFSHWLRRARLGLIVNDSQFSRWFARAYAGVGG